MPRSRKRLDPADLEIFTDRSLARRTVPDAVRAAGCIVHSMESVYGVKGAETILDEEWLELAGRRDWIVLTKDGAIRRNPVELGIVERFGVRMFVVTRAGLTAAEQIDRIVPNLHRIAQRASEPGPYVVGLYPNSIRQLWP